MLVSGWLTMVSIALGMAGALLLCVSAFYWQRSSRLAFPSTETANAHNARRKLEALMSVIDEKIRLNARGSPFHHPHRLLPGSLNDPLNAGAPAS